MRKMFVVVVVFVLCLVPSFVFAASAQGLKSEVEAALAGMPVRVEMPTRSTAETFDVYIHLQVGSAGTAKDEAIIVMDTLFSDDFPAIELCSIMTHVGRVPEGQLNYSPENDSYSWVSHGTIEKF